jgi:hypothetical protein
MKNRILTIRERTPHKAGTGWWYEEKWGISVYTDKSVVKIMLRPLKDAVKRINRSTRAGRNIK